MSAAPNLRARQIEVDESTTPISVRRPRPTAQPRPVVRVRQISRTLLNHVILMTLVSIVTWGFMILLGNSMMENARRERIRAMERAKLARQEVVRLHQRADRLASMAAIDEWARTTGFVPPAVDPEAWVANHGQAED